MELVAKRPPNNRLEMSVTIDNFGPIRSGKIELRPLTIFMGSNNSGKSYAALLIYSILSSGHRLIHDIVDGRIVRRIVENKDLYQHGSPLTSFNLEYDVNLVYEEFTQELRRNFSASLSDLILFKHEVCTLKISSRILHSTITLQNGRKPKYNSTDNWNRSVTVDHSGHCPPIIIDDYNNITVNADVTSVPSLRKKMLEYCHAIAPLVYYLPASRQGILQNHELLLSRYIRAASYAGIDDNRVPKISGGTVDFMDTLLTLSHKYGPCYKIAEQLESRMLRGSVTIKDTKSFPEIRYRHDGHIIPLHRAASMVSSTAPLVLYLKHRIKPGYVLIIEEPEAHLDPENQIALSKCLVDLIRRGVYVLISTHSPYMVEQLGNYLQAGGVSDKTKLPENKGRYIKRDELAVYSFESDQNMSVVKNVDVSEDGIDQKQFVSAFESIASHARAIEEL